MTRREIHEALTAAGFDVRVDMTGGNVHTLYIGPWTTGTDGVERATAVVGPFGPDPDEEHAPDNIAIGPDDDGATPAVYAVTLPSLVYAVERLAHPEPRDLTPLLRLLAPNSAFTLDDTPIRIADLIEDNDFGVGEVESIAGLGVGDALVFHGGETNPKWVLRRIA